MGQAHGIECSEAYSFLAVGVSLHGTSPWPLFLAALNVADNLWTLDAGQCRH